jgi:integrase
VTPEDLVSGPTGDHIRVWERNAKGDKYREPPVPAEVVTIGETLGYQQENDEPLIDVAGSTVYRWVRRAANTLEADTGDKGWQFLDVHDLRRTWGTYLLEQGVIPSVVMAWGGWEDWETFREHYLGEFSPEAIRRERGKVDHLEGGDENADVVHPGTLQL